MELQIDNPVIVALSGSAVLLAAGDFESNTNTDAQLWSPDNGYSEVKPLQVFYKFLYYIEHIDPPVPWVKR